MALEKKPTGNFNELKATQRVLLESKKFWSDGKGAEK